MPTQKRQVKPFPPSHERKKSGLDTSFFPLPNKREGSLGIKLKTHEETVSIQFVDKYIFVCIEMTHQCHTIITNN